MWPHPLNKDPVLISNSFKILHSAFSVIKNIVNLYSDDIQICHQRPNTTLKKGLGELEHKVHSEWFSSVQRLHPMSNRPVFPTAGFHCEENLEIIQNIQPCLRYILKLIINFVCNLRKGWLTLNRVTITEITEMVLNDVGDVENFEIYVSINNLELLR